MKRIINEEEKENYCVVMFDEINKINKETKDLNIKLINLQHNLSEVGKKYYDLQKEYSEMLKAKNGRGKYYKIISRPIEILEELENLQNATYDSYKRTIDEDKRKAYLLKKDILKEDLEKANQELTDFNVKLISVEKEYNLIEIEYKNIKNEIRKVSIRLVNLDRKKSNYLKKLRKINRAYDDKRKVNVKKYQS